MPVFTFVASIPSYSPPVAAHRAGAGVPPGPLLPLLELPVPSDGLSGPPASAPPLLLFAPGPSPPDAAPLEPPLQAATMRRTSAAVALGTVKSRASCMSLPRWRVSFHAGCQRARPDNRAVTAPIVNRLALVAPTAHKTLARAAVSRGARHLERSRVRCRD